MTGEIIGVLGKDKEALEDMRGLAGTKAVSPDHTVLYTLTSGRPGQGERAVTTYGPRSTP